MTLGMTTSGQQYDHDYIIIGSGFGGSVAALRLSEKGYRVLVLEKGKRLSAADFPKRNWNLRKWLWVPALRFFGFFRITLFRHLTVLSGVGVGGGSLVYANALQVPPAAFFRSGSWAGLADWEQELAPHYQSVITMLGAVPNPRLEPGDRALEKLAGERGQTDRFGPTTTAVFFGEPEVTVSDPYFGGTGPERAGCNFCGGCMVGCRFNAKNTLDKNYLFLAESLGAKVLPGSEAVDAAPVRKADGSEGYRVTWKPSTAWTGRKGSATCRGVVFSGGVLGTVKLLAKLRKSSLPGLSERVGHGVRTNSESLMGVMTFDKATKFSDGVAIGSILQTDEHSFIEPVRYPSGSGFWRLFMAPLAHGRSVVTRIAKMLFELARHPVENLRIYSVSNWAERTQILLFMRTIDSTLRLVAGRCGLRSETDQGEPPTAFIPEAKELAEHYARIVNGKPVVLLSETLLGIPTTAHILGGAVMGRDRSEGVIDSNNRVFGYRELYICDGSMVSANPGVNPSLTIAALAERAMARIPPKGREQENVELDAENVR
jgi:cholesterol oxidase